MVWSVALHRGGGVLPLGGKFYCLRQGTLKRDFCDAFALVVGMCIVAEVGEKILLLLSRPLLYGRCKKKKSGSPWVYMYSDCHQMITHLQPKGPRGVVRGLAKIGTFQLTHAGQNAAKSSPVGPHREADIAGTLRSVQR